MENLEANFSDSNEPADIFPPGHEIMEAKAGPGKACETPGKREPLLSVALFSFAISVLLVVCSAFNIKGNDEEKIAVNRIEYFYRLKSLADKFVWEGFDNPAFELPLIYYTERYCYVVNPTPKFLSIYKPSLIHKKGRIKIYKTGLLDSTAFHMETFMSLDDTAAYDYKSMFMRCSSLEVTKLQPQADMLNVERWVTMVLHEYFHGFQFTHPAFAAYHTDSIIPVLGETLKKIYDDNAGVKESIDRENDLLLKAIETDNLEEAATLVDSFFMIRTSRQDIIKGLIYKFFKGQ